MLQHLRAHLKGKVVILAVGNTLRSDDALGPVLAGRIKDKVPFKVFDAGPTPENYFGKIIREAPDNLVVIDAVDFGAKAGEFSVIEASALKTANLFATHNASISLVSDYLQNNLAADIIFLAIQPKTTVFGENLSPEVTRTLDKLEDWFCEAGKEER
ncbi:MAG: hydrogenase 3 maturation endopeptidase HyCI [Candidatus Omnitrophota bacterium]